MFHSHHLHFTSLKASTWPICFEAVRPRALVAHVIRERSPQRVVRVCVAIILWVPGGLTEKRPTASTQEETSPIWYILGSDDLSQSGPIWSGPGLRRESPKSRCKIGHFNGKHSWHRLAWPVIIGICRSSSWKIRANEREHVIGTSLCLYSLQ